MSEPVPDYDGARAVTCQECGGTIGIYEGEIDRVVLRVGSTRLVSADGRCQCGAEWHWNASAHKLDYLINRILANR